MTASLAYRKNEPAILRGEVPEKYTRIVPYVPDHHILEIGSAEGVLALLLAQAGKDVACLERSRERHEAAINLARKWGIYSVRHFCGDIRDSLFLLNETDTLVAVRMIYYLGDALDEVFAEVAKKIPNVVLCGNKNRAQRWREGNPDPPLGEMNRYAASEGMTDLLKRHGYRIVTTVTEGDEIVVGRKDG